MVEIPIHSSLKLVYFFSENLQYCKGANMSKEKSPLGELLVSVANGAPYGELSPEQAIIEDLGFQQAIRPEMLALHRQGRRCVAVTSDNKGKVRPSLQSRSKH